MHHRIPLTDNGMRLIRKTPAIVELALDERLVPLAKAINIPPRARAGKGELVRRGADHGTVSFVQGEDFVRLPPAEEGVRVQGVAPSGGKRAGESVERVPDVGIDDLCQDDEEGLRPRSLVSAMVSSIQRKSGCLGGKTDCRAERKRACCEDAQAGDVAINGDGGVHGCNERDCVPGILRACRASVGYIRPTFAFVEKQIRLRGSSHLGFGGARLRSALCGLETCGV